MSAMFEARPFRDHIQPKIAAAEAALCSLCVRTSVSGELKNVKFRITYLCYREEGKWQN
jgi:hypothetical protein